MEKRRACPRVWVRWVAIVLDLNTDGRFTTSITETGGRYPLPRKDCMPQAGQSDVPILKDVSPRYLIILNGQEVSRLPAWRSSYYLIFFSDDPIWKPAEILKIIAIIVLPS